MAAAQSDCPSFYDYDDADDAADGVVDDYGNSCVLALALFFVKRVVVAVTLVVVVLSVYDDA